MSSRLDELDSLRGLAALTVLGAHFIGSLPAYWDPGNDTLFWLVRHTPLGIIFAGGEAVILFYILSGFVLSLPFYARSVQYGAFLLRRFFRIYLPYWVAVALALLLSTFPAQDAPPVSGTWMEYVWSGWSGPMRPDQIASQFLLVLSYDTGRLLAVDWSLVHEMRISLVFPIIMHFIRAWDWRATFAVAYVASIAGVLLHLISGSGEVGTNYFVTLVYLPMFVSGALIAKHRVAVAQRFTTLSGSAKSFLVVFAIFAYTIRIWLTRDGTSLHTTLALVEPSVIGLGASILLIVVLAPNRFRSFLLLRPLLAIGKISYSIYLLHTVFLVASMRILLQFFPIWTTLIVALAMTAFGSALLYGLVERTSVSAGRRISRGIDRRFSI